MLKLDSVPSVILQKPEFPKGWQIYFNFGCISKHSLLCFIHLFVQTVTSLKKKNDRRVPPYFRKEIKFKKRKVRKHLFVPHLTVSSDALMVEDRSRNPLAG